MTRSLGPHVVPHFCSCDHSTGVYSSKPKLVVEVITCSVLHPTLVHGTRDLRSFNHKMLHVTPGQVRAANEAKILSAVHH